MDTEDAFAAEAQEEAILSRKRSFQEEEDRKSPSQIDTREDEGSETEQSPLIPNEQRPQRHQLSRAAQSYNRAISKPWTGAQGSAGLPWYKKPSILWLLPGFFPFCVAFGGLLVPRTYLVLDLICQDYLNERAANDPTFHFMPVIFGSENPQCRDPHVQARVARLMLYVNLIGGIFSAVVTPHIGALSDRRGRTKVMAMASCGSFVMEIIYIIVGRRPREVSVYWILLGAFFDGICGSFTSSMALAFAYSSDCTSPERRNVAFGYFHGTLFAGIALGPILAGYVIKATGNILVCFYIAMGCHLFFILFVLLIIPESLSKERQMLAREKWRTEKQKTEQNSWATAVRNYNLLRPLWVLWPKGAGSSSRLRKNLFLLAAIDTTMFGVAMGAMSILIIYAEYKFGWDAYQSSILLSAANVCRVTGLVLILPLLTRFIRGPIKSQPSGSRGADMLDINIIRAAIIFDLLGYIGYAFVPTGGLLVVSGMIAALGGMGSPTLQSALTKSIPSDRTGQMLGASGLLHALARVVAPTVFNLIYAQTVGIFPGTVFICLASLFVLAAIMSCFLEPHVYLDEASLADGSMEVES